MGRRKVRIRVDRLTIFCDGVVDPTLLTKAPARLLCAIAKLESIAVAFRYWIIASSKWYLECKIAPIRL